MENEDYCLNRAEMGEGLGPRDDLDDTYTRPAITDIVVIGHYRAMTLILQRTTATTALVAADYRGIIPIRVRFGHCSRASFSREHKQEISELHWLHSSETVEIITTDPITRSCYQFRSVRSFWKINHPGTDHHSHVMEINGWRNADDGDELRHHEKVCQERTHLSWNV